MIIIVIATNGGHVARALDFYNTPDKYFILGGTQPWTHAEEGQIITDDTKPISPAESDFKLIDVVGLKRVDNIYLVVEDPEGSIKYRETNWRIVHHLSNKTTLSNNVSSGATSITVGDLAGMTPHAKIRIGDIYDATIISVDRFTLTLDKAAPQDITAGTSVVRDPFVEGAKYVYLDCTLRYDEFPIVPSYRQIGLCTRVTPTTDDPIAANILRSAEYSDTGINEYESLGILEILDNRIPSSRDINQQEKLSIIIEF